MRKGEFPNKLKNIDISPVLKKGDKHEKSNYRPVILLLEFSCKQNNF